MATYDTLFLYVTVSSQFDYTDIVVWDDKLYEVIAKYENRLGVYSPVPEVGGGWVYQLRRGEHISSWIAEKYLKMAGVCSECDGATIDDYLCERCRKE